MIPPLAILLAQIVGLGFACGLDLYATVALLGVGSRLDWFPALPLGLRGLESGVIIGSALALFAVEFVVDKIPFADSFWDVVHTVIRPLAAGLLALVALAGMPVSERVSLAALAATAALAMHGSKAGLRVALNTRRRPSLTVAVSILEDLIAVALTLAALLRPQLALAGVALLLLLMAVRAPGLWRAATLGVRAAVAWLRGFFGDPGWRQPAQLPPRLRKLVRPEELGGAPPRATRAALTGLPGTGAYRNGWLLVERGALAFVHYSLFSARRIELPRAEARSVRKAVLADVVEFQSPQSQFTLFLLKDGPPTEVMLAEITTAAEG